MKTKCSDLRASPGRSEIPYVYCCIKSSKINLNLFKLLPIFYIRLRSWYSVLVHFWLANLQKTKLNKNPWTIVAHGSGNYTKISKPVEFYADRRDRIYVAIETSKHGQRFIF